MAYYVITDGNGNYIRHDVGTGKYVPIRSLKGAKQFDNILKANAVLKNSISSSIRSFYEVRLVDTSYQVDKITPESENKQSEIIFREVEDDNIQDWLSKINIIRDTLSGSGQRENELQEKLSEIDKEIVDINHYIEFGNYNACQGWRCFKMLQQLLRQRRKYKNELSVIQMIKACNFDPDAVSRLSDKISESTKKTYMPRAFPELFNGTGRKQSGQ